MNNIPDFNPLEFISRFFPHLMIIVLGSLCIINLTYPKLAEQLVLQFEGLGGTPFYTQAMNTLTAQEKVLPNGVNEVGTTTPPTKTEMQDMNWMCSLPSMASACTAEFWAGYAKNPGFRKSMDAVALSLRNGQQEHATSSVAHAMGAK